MCVNCDVLREALRKEKDKHDELKQTVNNVCAMLKDIIVLLKLKTEGVSNENG